MIDTETNLKMFFSYLTMAGEWLESKICQRIRKMGSKYDKTRDIYTRSLITFRKEAVIQIGNLLKTLTALKSQENEIATNPALEN